MTKPCAARPGRGAALATRHLAARRGARDAASRGAARRSRRGIAQRDAARRGISRTHAGAGERQRRR